MKCIRVLLMFCFFVQINLYGQNTLGVIKNDSLALNAYTLFSTGLSTYLIDNCGHLINQWQTESRPGLVAYLQENGNLIRAGSTPGIYMGAGFGGLLEEYNWEGELVWSFVVANDAFQQHHDIEILPNGNILFIAWEGRTPEEAIANGAINEARYWSPAVYEIKKIGEDSAEYVWEWHLWDHLIQDFDATKENFGVVSEHPELMNINMEAPQSLGSPDWIHLNGIDYDPVRDEIILSSRHLNEIYILDHSTTTEEAAGHSGGKRGHGGDFIYRWGNPRAYDKGSNLDQKLFGQHNAEIIPEGFFRDGNISIFNNGIGRPGGNYSTIDEISPPRDFEGNYVLNANGVFGPSNLAWQYVAEDMTSFFSSNMGGTKRLENGNMSICESRSARFFEVTSAGKIVWEYENPVSITGILAEGANNDGIAASFRAERYPVNYPAFVNRDIEPGEVLELDPADFQCEIFDVVSSNDVYSEMQDISVEVLGNTSIQIHSNHGSNLSYRVFNLGGETLRKGIHNNFTQIDISSYTSGIYYLIVNGDKSQFIQKFVKY